MAAGASFDDDDKRLETVRLEALQASASGPDVGHRLIARRLFRAGQADKALSELIRFSRERPMTPRMATALATLALSTGRTGPILTLLTQGVEETEGRERVGVMRALARLQRRMGQVEPAIETLSVLLAEAAEDRRSRLVLNALLEQQGQWEALDASLDKETRLLLRRRYFRAASRTALRRARLWGERLDDAPRAALRYGQAAQYAEQGQDPHSVFLLRLLWLRALVEADAPSRTRDEATRVTLEAASRVGRDARARAFVRELGLPLPAELPDEGPAEVTVAGEAPPAPTGRDASTTLADFEAAAAEPPPRGPVGDALLAVSSRSSSAAVEALSRLEARYVAQGAWTELARFYRQTADGRPPEERASWLEKLAELLESELDDTVGAAGVWAEVAQLTGEAEAVSEQVRLLDERKDAVAVKRALDAGVGRAQAPAEKARLLVLRAQEARQRGDDAAARADFVAALETAPGTLEAAAGLAELSVARGDVGPLKTFERLLVSASRQLPERAALFRRLARLADVMREARLASAAWTEVMATSPADDEALDRGFTLARALKDDARLEAVSRALLTKDPRGLKARAAWLELVAVLERTGRAEAALTALRDAVKAEPGHLEAWLALVDRLVSRGLDDEAAWAMEHASTAAPEGPARISMWKRLARHARERLADDERAEKYEERLERVRASQAPPAHAAPALPGGPLVVPPRTSRPRLEPVRTPALSARDEAESNAFAEALGAEREPEDTREMPVVIPSRLQHVLGPIVKDVETREAPADDFIDDDDIDEVMEVRSEEVEAPIDSGPPRRRAAADEDPDTTPVPPPAQGKLRPLTGRDESERATLPTRSETAWREPPVSGARPAGGDRAPAPPPAPEGMEGGVPSARRLIPAAAPGGVGARVVGAPSGPASKENDDGSVGAGRRTGPRSDAAPPSRQPGEGDGRSSVPARPAGPRSPLMSEPGSDGAPLARRADADAVAGRSSAARSEGEAGRVGAERPRSAVGTETVPVGAARALREAGVRMVSGSPERGAGAATVPARIERASAPVDPNAPTPGAGGRGGSASESEDAVPETGKVAAWSEPETSGPSPRPGATASAEARAVTGRDDDRDEPHALPTGRATAWREEDAEVAPASVEDAEDVEVSEVTAPPPADEARRTAEIPVAPALGDPLASVPPSFGPSPSKLLSDERQALFERVRANPLEAEGYRLLAEHFDTANDANRSSLMLELARALEGDPNAAPRTPKLILSATDRAGLRHPLVRTEAAELVALATPAICRLFPAKGKDAVTTEEFSLERGKGAKPAADALLAAVRLLGMRAPDVYVSDEAGPPFTALQAVTPRLVVSRLAVKKALPDAELRFYAGRALFTLSPELLALRTLKRDQLRAGLEAVGNALRGHATTEARLVRDALSPRSLEKLKALWPKVAKTVDLGALMEGARHSVNRAGLVVCGGIAPVIESLRVKRALPVEVTELVRFAASERYLQLRNRRLGKKP
jgi:tetratricopeptide (TPR) repeat protein